MFSPRQKLCLVNFAINLRKVVPRESLYQYGKVVTKRKFSEKRYSDLKRMLEEKSRFDKDFNTPENILLYSYPGKELKHTMIVTLGLTAFLVLANSAQTVYISWNTMKTEGIKQGWRKKLASSQTVKYVIMVTMILSGIVIAYLSHFYVRCVVKSITLLKGGDAINLETYRAFGKSDIRKVNIDQITSVRRHSKETVTDYTIKVKEDKVGYILDMRDGRIHDKETFDRTIGVFRTIAN